MITKRSISKPNSIEEFGEIAISKKKPKFLLLASTIQFSNHHAPHVSNPPRREQAYSMWASNRTTTDVVGWRSGSPKAYPYHSRTGRIPSKPLISSTPASPCETVEPFHEHGAHTGHGTVS